MAKYKFSKAEFLKSALGEEGWPLLRTLHGSIMPEIVVAGRSNVGKSSLLNHLLLQRKLAKVSATPGKTNTINFFIIDDTLALVDLPGYGYAKVSKELKENWGQHLDYYMQNREQISLILLLIDIRRDLTPEDIAFLEWSRFNNKPLLLVFTKCDKASKEEQKAQAEKLLKLYVPNEYCFYTIKDQKSRITLINTINRMLNGPN